METHLVKIPARSDFTIAEFLAWARTKPVDERYSYCNSNRCALAQFGMATGREHLVGPGGTSLLFKSKELNRAVGGDDDLADADLTFGKLAERLEALLVSDTWTKADAYATDIESVEA
jgi:hypothetical protein